MSIDKVLNERGSRYGDFADVATVSQDLQHVLFCAADQKLADDQREAIQMICSKLARIVCGDHNYADSWTDIAGYATLIEKRLLGGQNDEWPSDERIDTIGQNGNDGAVYESQCWCEKCNIRTFTLPGTSQAIEVRTMMALCPQCGDKRCERAKHHDNECSAKKQYRDLEKPETWKLGDYATMEWQSHAIKGEIIEISENSYGDLCFTVDSDNMTYAYSCATSVEARS